MKPVSRVSEESTALSDATEREWWMKLRLGAYTVSRNVQKCVNVQYDVFLSVY